MLLAQPVKTFQTIHTAKVLSSSLPSLIPQASGCGALRALALGGRGDRNRVSFSQASSPRNNDIVCERKQAEPFLRHGASSVTELLVSMHST